MVAKLESNAASGARISLSGLKSFERDFNMFLLLGCKYRTKYEYDPIGNRINASEGDTDRTAAYTANALNQYTQRTVPNEKDVIGTAPTNVTVTVNEAGVSRQSAYWHHALSVTNTTAAAFPRVEITAVYNPPGTNTPDVVSSVTGRIFVAKTPEEFTYDDDGNMTSDGRFNYEWNAENRLIRAETRTGLPAEMPRIKLDMQYDYQGRRVQLCRSVTNGLGGWRLDETKRFAYDGWNMVRETRTVSAGSVSTNWFVWGLDLSGSIQGAGGVGGLLLANLGGINTCYAYDANGNVGQILNALTPTNILAHYEYSPFGETIISSGPLTDVNPFRFSTKYWDTETKTLAYQLRDYGPGMGRWLSRDPITERGAWVLQGTYDIRSLFWAELEADSLPFVFCYNTPIGSVDPNGESPLALAAVSAVLVYFGGSWLTGIISAYDVPPSCGDAVIKVSQYQHCVAHCVQSKYFGALPAMATALLSELVPLVIGRNSITGVSDLRSFLANWRGVGMGLVEQRILGTIPKFWRSCSEYCEDEYCLECGVIRRERGWWE